MARFLVLLALLVTLAPVPPLSAAEPGAQPNSLKILVEQDRLYRVNVGDVGAAGAPIGQIDPARINLYNEGRTVPIAIEGLTKQGAFGPGSAIIFWGEYPRGKETRADLFTKENAYTLLFDSPDPPARYQRAGTPPQPPADEHLILTRPRTLHLEQDNELFFHQKYDGLPTDRVMWRRFMAPPREGGTVALDSLPDLAPGARPAKIRVLLWGSSHPPGEPDHDWNIYLNDGLLGRATWDGTTHFIFESKAIAEFFRPGGTNVLTLKNNLEKDQIDAILLDWIEIEYEATLAPAADFLEFELPGKGALSAQLSGGFSGSPIRVFDVGAGIELTIQSRPERGSKTYGASFLYESGAEKVHFAAAGPGGYAKPARMVLGYPSDLRGIKAAPEYLLVAHRDFFQGAAELVERRRSQGLSALLVDIEDVYDEYSNGRFAPQALKLFIDELLAKPAADGKGLRYVFLVGDATYDYKNVKQDSKTFVPTWHSEKGFFLTDWLPMNARDDYFVSGAGGEFVPKAAIGRLPCRKPEELRSFLDKLVETESAPDSAAWTRRAVLIGAEGFTGLCDQIAGQTPLNNWSLDKVYATPGDVQGNTKLQASIIESLSRGEGVVFFAGHGALLRWRTGPVDVKQQTDMFAKEHLDQLTNRGRYPVAFAATCYSAMYDNPGRLDGAEAGIGVHMVEAPGKGAIALIAPVGKVTSESGEIFSARVVQELYGGKAPRLGDAYLVAKKEFIADDYAGITLIGDPATFFGKRYAAGRASP